MQKLLFVLTAVSAVFALCSCMSAETKRPRKIAVQMWSTHFHKFDYSVERLAKMGVKYVECYPGQSLSDKLSDAKFGHNMTAEQKAFAKKLLADNGIQMVSYGCVGGKTEADIRKVCEFAAEMGAKTVVTEAMEDTIPIWNKICAEYGLQMALHSHERKPDNPGYRHFDPAFLMTILKDYKNVGICADNGAWSRSGLDVVGGFKSVRGKLIEIHLKDQQKFGDLKSGCAVYGEGVLDMEAILKEVDSQGFDGFFVIEDGTYRDSFPIIEKNLKYLREH